MQPRERLTSKELQVAALVWEGSTNREIARVIDTTEQVVKNYLRKVYDKLGVADRLELALYCLNHHVVDNTKVPPLPMSGDNGRAANAAAAGASGSSAPSASGATPTANSDSSVKPS